MTNRILAGLVLLIVLIAIGFFVIAYQQRMTNIESALQRADATLTAIHD